MASDGESIIYIADAATGFVHKFSPSGEPRLSFQDDRTNLRPADIAVDAGAAIYVAGRAETIAEGVLAAREALADGRAAEALERYVQASLHHAPVKATG